MRYEYIYRLFLILIIVFVQKSLLAKVLLVPQKYSTIQSAVDASNPDDTVLVSPGTYYENINFKGKSVTVTGNGTAESVVIDGGRNNGSTVTFSSEETGASILDGLTLTGGTGTNTSDGLIGGGIFIQDGASPQIKNCIIKDNYASLGGGIGQWSSSGIGGNPIISYCLIYGDSADAYGGGIWMRASSGSINNCTIVQNKASQGSNIILTSFSAGVVITNSIIWYGTIGGVGSYNYCDIQGGWSGNGNIDKDPLLCDPDSYDFHIAANSPCIENGQDKTLIGAYGVGCDSIATIDTIQTAWQRTADIPEVKTLFTKDNKLYAGTWYDGVYLSTDSGANWSAIDSGISNYAPINAFVADNNNLYVAMWNSIFHSTDTGQTWSLVKDDFPYNSEHENIVNTLLMDGSLLYAGTSSGIYVSENNGKDWIELSDYNVTSIIMDGTTLFIGTWGSGIYYSVNEGQNWTMINSGLTNLYIRFISVCNSKIFTGTDEGSIFISTDNGKGWLLINESMKDQDGIWPGVYCFLCSGNKLYAATTGNGIYFSNNDNVNWTEMNNGLPKNLGGYTEGIFSLSILNNEMFAAVDPDGVWKLSLPKPVTSVNDNSFDLPAHFTLFQNYPNPFNPSTTIEYSIPKQAHVTLKVFDLLGREVKTLINEEIPAGNYKVDFNGSNIPSGIYFYSIEAGRYSATKKLLLLK